MARTTSKMGLRVWDTLNDPYDHDQLADNWAKVDQHDHTSNRGVQIPTDGLADGAVSAAKLASGLDPTAAFTSYRNVSSEHHGVLAASAAATTRVVPVQDGTGSIVSLSVATAPYYAIPIDVSEFAISGRTTLFRLKLTLFTGTPAPGVKDRKSVV